MDEDVVFRALADPTRRRLLDRLHERAGQTLGELYEGLGLRRQSISQHLDLLAEATLVTTVRDGRRKLHYLNPVPLHRIQTRWIWAFEEPRLDALEAVRQHAEENSTEERTMTGSVPDYVYTTYIRATPDLVWHALTDPELTARFWGHAQVSDWTPGSRIEHVRTDGSGTADAAGTVVEVDPPRRLVFDFDDPRRADEPTREPSRVTFDLEPGDGIVKLTVTHTLLPSAEDREAAGHGWPAVFANLKTLLETGDVLPQAPWEFHADERAERMERNE